jgi:hypothetical protein
MTTSMAIFWEKLQQVNLVQGKNPTHDTVHSPWFIKLLLAISGWLGAIFLLGFILLAVHSLLEEPITAFMLSIPLFISAYLILRAPNNEFYEHLALALSLAGQGLFVLSIFEWDSVELIWLSVGILQALLTYFMPMLFASYIFNYYRYALHYHWLFQQWCNSFCREYYHFSSGLVLLIRICFYPTI